MTKSLFKMGIYCSLFLSLAGAVKAQSGDTVAEFKPSGKLWGYAFGDYAWKGSSDEANRGGSNQYTNVPLNSNIFQWRRIYLGYDYNISSRFSAEFLLAAEDDWAGGVLGQPAASVTVNTVTGTGKPALGNNGDIILNNKFAPYIKLANLRWKNLWRGTDLIIGQSATPTFAKNGSGMAEEEVWAYRSIERTPTDVRRTGSFDMGLSLQGRFDHEGNFGYTAMVGNGQGAKPEGDMFKWFYGDVWAKFFDKHLIVDLYQDYEKIDWGVHTAASALNGPRYHDRNMTKLFAAWNAKMITIGVEGYMNTIMGDVVVTGKDGNTYYRTSKAMGLSAFVRGRIVSNEKDNQVLGYFVRFDNYDPSGNLTNIANDANTSKYSASTSQYEPTTKEMFTTFGIDFTPVKNVHIMPNVWMNTYTSALDVNGKNGAGTSYSSMNGNVTGIKGTDAVYRLTFYYVYGK